MRNLFLLLLLPVLFMSVCKFAWCGDSSEPKPLKSDANLDNRIDAKDLFTLLQEWRQIRKQDPPSSLKDEQDRLPAPGADSATTNRTPEPIFTGFGPEVFVGEEDSDGEFTVRKREANLDFSIMGAARESRVSTLRFEPFPDVVLDARITRRYVRTPDRYSLIGTIGEGPIGEFIVTVRDGYVQGRMRTPDGRLYFVQGKNGTSIEVREVELKEGFVCHVGQENSWDRKAAAERKKRLSNEKIAKGTPSCPTPMYDDGSSFDILVVYTPWARCAAEGGSYGNRASCLSAYPTEDGAILCGIDQVVDDLNAAFENSGITPEGTLVHSQEVGANYAQEGNMGAACNDAQTPDNGKLDEVPIIRDYYNADMVVLVVNNGGDTVPHGLTNFLATSVSEMETGSETAYCVVNVPCVYGAGARPKTSEVV